MAAKKTTSKKTTKTAARGQTARRPAEPERVLSRAAWGAVWAVLGLLCLLSILPIDGVDVYKRQPANSSEVHTSLYISLVR